MKGLVLFTVPHEMKGCPPMKAGKPVQQEFIDKCQKMCIARKPDEASGIQKYKIQNTIISDAFKKQKKYRDNSTGSKGVYILDKPIVF